MSFLVAGATPGVILSSASARTATGNGSTIISLWLKPTLLSASDTFYQLDTAVTFAEINNSSGQIRVGVDRGTTDTNLTTGNVLLNNTWNYFCFAFFGQSTVTTRCWVGTDTSIPVLQTLSGTAGAGNVTNAVNITVGSQTNQFTAMAGYVSQFVLICQSTVDVDIYPGDEYVFNRFVYPLYNGTFDLRGTEHSINGTPISAGNNGGVKFAPFDSPPSSSRYPFYELSTGNLAAQQPAITVASATTTSTYNADEPRCNRFSASITNGASMPLLMRR